jgi:denticleless
VTSVVFLAHNSHHLMTSGSVDDVIKCWDWRSLGFTSKSGPRPVMSSTSVNKQCGLSWLAQDAQGRFVYAVSTANRIHQYSAQHLGQPLRTFTAPDYAVRSFYVRAAVHPQGHLLAAGSSNGRLYVWDTTRLFSTNEPLCTLNTDTTNEVSGVDWQDEQTLASVSDDALLRVWR